MKVTVCELGSGPGFVEEWEALSQYVKELESELVLLPELPFHRWLPASRKPCSAQWDQSVKDHEAWISRLADLGSPVVVGTRPITEKDHNFNEGFVWKAKEGVMLPVHRKRYLPEETGFWEASWYARGSGAFAPFAAGTAQMGLLICTDLWFFRHARDYGQKGVQILACPRATPASSVDRWIAGGRAAAIVSGSFCISSNHSGRGVGEELGWGGTGWIIEPEGGEVLGTTSREKPFLTLDLDLAAADAAKLTYPRYVEGD